MDKARKGPGRLLLQLFLVLVLGMCGVMVWSSNTLRNPVNFSRGESPPYSTRPMPDQLFGVDKEVEKGFNICRRLHTGVNISSVFMSRLHTLRKFIPTTFSAKFKNPCWYDFHPNLLKLSPFHCVTPRSFDPLQAKKILEGARSLGTRRLYCLPSFFILGFPKCATTTMYESLVKHPLVAEAMCKECQFWTIFIEKQGRNIDKDMQTLWYISYSSQATQTIESNPQTMTLDGSVSYLVWNSEKNLYVLPNLLMRVLPEAKFIVIMRNPSERVFSRYFFFTVRKYVEEARRFANITEYVHSTAALETFHRNTVAVIARFQSCVRSRNDISHCIRNKTIDEQFKKGLRNGRVGLQHSLYYYHILPWLNCFPRERFLFLKTEDLANSASLTMSNVWHFLGINDLPDTKEVFANVNEKAKSPTFPLQTKKLLDDFFHPHNQLLAKLLQDTRFLWKD